MKKDLNATELYEKLKKNNIFLTGGAGVGKSWMINEIIKLSRKNKKNIIKLGSTAIAAVNINGVTIHSFFRLGIANTLKNLQDNENSKGLKISRELINLIDLADIIIIDEISMVSSDLMDMIKYRLDKTHFKGKILVCGDFCQLPPVIRHKTDKIFAFESDLWQEKKFKTIELTESKRTMNLEFFNILKDIRKGIANDSHFDFLESLKKNSVIVKDSTILVGTNQKAKEVNSSRLDEINEPKYKISLVAQAYEKRFEKQIEKFIGNSNFEKQLEIKVGAKIIFTKNGKDFYNGLRGTIVNINTHNVYDKNLEGTSEDYKIVVKLDNDDTIHVQPSITTQSKFEVETNPITGESKIVEKELFFIKQFPIKLAYAITIHKSQGMSINNLICNINNLFTNAQFYVSISRATSPDKLKLVHSNPNTFREDIENNISLNPKIIQFYEDIDKKEIQEKEKEKIIKKELEIRKKKIDNNEEDIDDIIFY